MSEIGKALRLARLTDRASGRMLCVAMDHGMQVGVIPGIEDPLPLIDAVMEAGVDAVIVSPGLLLRHGRRFAGGPAVILRIDQTTMWRTDPRTVYPDAHSRLVATVEEAAALGADAVITYLLTLNGRPEEETRSFEIAGAVGTACRRLGIVHVIEAMVARGGLAASDDPDMVAFNCRIAGEMGADVVKTDWCDPARFRAIAAQSLAPVAVAGGTARDSYAETLRFAEAAVGAGAFGLMFGRNVFQQPDVAAALRDLGRAVHGR